jgi:hypothetical protein
MTECLCFHFVLLRYLCENFCFPLYHIQRVPDIRHFDICPLSFTSLLNFYPNFNIYTSLKTTYIEELVTDIELFLDYVTFHWFSIYVIFDIRLISTGTNRDGYRGLSVRSAEVEISKIANIPMFVASRICRKKSS